MHIFLQLVPVALMKLVVGIKWIYISNSNSFDADNGICCGENHEIQYVQKRR